MTIPKVRPPKYFKPKKGGLVDAVRNDMFLEWICGIWPENEPKISSVDKGVPDETRDAYDYIPEDERENYHLN